MQNEGSPENGVRFFLSWMVGSENVIYYFIHFIYAILHLKMSGGITENIVIEIWFVMVLLERFFQCFHVLQGFTNFILHYQIQSCGWWRA